MAVLPRDSSGESRAGVERTFDLVSLLGRHCVESEAVATAQPFKKTFVEFVHAFTFPVSRVARQSR